MDMRKEIAVGLIELFGEKRALRFVREYMRQPKNMSVDARMEKARELILKGGNTL